LTVKIVTKMLRIGILLYVALFASAQKFVPLLNNILYQEVNTSVFNVKSYGARADGVNDDTAAIQRAISVLSFAGGVLYFPTGRYLIKSKPTFKVNGRFTIVGDGLSSVLLWAVDDNLIYIPSGCANQITINDFMITSYAVPKNLKTFGIYAEDMIQSQIQHVWINTQDNVNLSGGIAMRGVTDSNLLREVQIWRVSGTGIEIGHGSEVRISGGRVIGVSNRKDGIGIIVSGNNGGVHIDTTDIIALGTGLLLKDLYGKGSNREIFLTHVTLDSCGRGLAVYDNSYISIAGLWAASSDIDQIWVNTGTNALITITGGTIFNGGIYECPDNTTMCNGMTVNSGSFMLTGVEIRNNKGRGIWVPNPNVVQYTINGCHIFENGQGLNLVGDEYVVTSNICSRNAQANYFGGTGGLIQNNIKC
jgi:hypothetical protein